MALPGPARAPRRPELPLRIVRFSPDSLAFGVMRPEIEGLAVPITDPAKTVADCFKFRSKVGVDVAVEALRGYLERSRWDCDLLGWTWGPREALRQAARACRMERVVAPYLEALA